MIVPCRRSDNAEGRQGRTPHAQLQPDTELGRRIGLPQTHISNIEAGRIVPRFDTLLDIVRTLDHDLLMVPRSLVPAVQALVRDQQHDNTEEEWSLYADDDS
jgi:hypothetical protein